MTPSWPARPRVLVLGAGLMGAPIAAEYAAAGLDVTVAARDPDRTRAHLARVVDDAVGLDLLPAGAAEHLSVVADPAEQDDQGPFHLVVESLPEQLELKVAALGPVAERWPDATVATNTSSLSVSELGARIGAPERTLATHYLNPVLLMPIVEVVPGTGTCSDHVDQVSTLLRNLGKVPIAVADVPGFVINRLQFAVLRECSWLVGQGVVDAADLDRIVTEGLARRWRRTGPLATAALGGVRTFERIAANLFPVLAGREHGPALPGVPVLAPHETRQAAEARDAALRLDFS